MGWGNKAIEIRSAETGHLDGVFMHKKAQKLKFLCERNDKVFAFFYLYIMGIGFFFKLWVWGGSKIAWKNIRKQDTGFVCVTRHE